MKKKILVFVIVVLAVLGFAYLLEAGSRRSFFENLIPTSDAGRECNDTSQCQGACLALQFDNNSDVIFNALVQGNPIKAKGKCSSKAIVLGCNPEVENGIVVELCRD